MTKLQEIGDIILLESKLTESRKFLSSAWSLEILALIWLYFSMLFVYFETRDRRHQLNLEDKGDPEDNQPNRMSRCYTIRLRSEPVASNYPDQQACIHIKFFYLKEKLGHLQLPIIAFRRYGSAYTDKKGIKYCVLLFHWYTSANLSTIDEIRICHSSKPESPKIYFRDFDVREPELKVRLHVIITRAISPFPFVPGSGISLTPVTLKPEESDDFRSPYEKLTKPEIVIFMFAQSNLAYLLTLWLPSLNPNAVISSYNSIFYGLSFYGPTTIIMILVVVYYQISKIHFSPLRRTNLKRFRKTFILSITLSTSILVLITALRATTYPAFPFSFWLTLTISGHLFQAIVVTIAYYWYNSKFSLELAPSPPADPSRMSISPLTRCIQPDKTKSSGDTEHEIAISQTQDKSISV